MSSFSVSRSFPMSRTRWGWLPLSVALNLVLIGIILGYASRSHEAAPRQALVTWQRELLPSLPPADVPATLKRWLALHWIRVVLAVVASLLAFFAVER